MCLSAVRSSRLNTVINHDAYLEIVIQTHVTKVAGTFHVPLPVAKIPEFSGYGTRRVPATLRKKVSGTVYLSFGLPCGRAVISRPRFLVAVLAHVSSPNGEPRWTLRRMAASSASV